MRLDKYLCEQYNFSRTQAKELVVSKCVRVNDKTIEKCSFEVKEEDEVKVLKQPEYVSRGAYKLKGALEYFGIQLKDKVVMDIGASTGGFSQVCLEADAKKVFALDVGQNQIHSSLLKSERLVVMEKINCRYLSKSIIEQPIDFLCMDVSFISIDLILPNIIQQFTEIKEFVVLIKPQFEVGLHHHNKNGVVKDKKVVSKMLESKKNYYKSLGLEVFPIIKADIIGKKGNQEYILYLKR